MSTPTFILLITLAVEAGLLLFWGLGSTGTGPTDPDRGQSLAQRNRRRRARRFA